MENMEQSVKTIGQLIGVVSQTFSIKNDQGDKVQLSVKIDFRSASDNDLKGWLVSNRVIAGQRPWRSLSAKELSELNGQTFNACAIGQKVKSREQQKVDLMTTFMNVGATAEQAEAWANAALDDPSSLTIKSEV